MQFSTILFASFAAVALAAPNAEADGPTLVARGDRKHGETCQKRSDCVHPLICKKAAVPAGHPEPKNGICKRANE